MSQYSKLESHILKKKGRPKNFERLFSRKQKSLDSKTRLIFYIIARMVSSDTTSVLT